jgi:peptide-methionine (S)-S-oxide reductase
VNQRGQRTYNKACHPRTVEMFLSFRTVRQHGCTSAYSVILRIVGKNLLQCLLISRSPGGRTTRMSSEQSQLHSQPRKELATLGGGCFWCLEAVYLELKGVEQVVSGYSGGTDPNPSYYEVCEGITGHAEVVQLTFEPQEISFKDILQVFFTIHDPTTLNRQGADVGTQYRSVIFYHTQEQKETAEEVIRELTADRIWDSPIVTEITPAEIFYPAEDYHQDYFQRNMFQPYCQYVIVPKVIKLRKLFLEKLKR